ncbi:MAG: hypothetical protein JXX29_19715 [Deltaproteobacteria bacterium]|nr:hypothetical protein [Deltaproteobacteria bacterium]MBN2673918.1 hypothetical protein [Deltaproteobacteria bacterium]
MRTQWLVIYIFVWTGLLLSINACNKLKSTSENDTADSDPSPAPGTDSENNTDGDTAVSDTASDSEVNDVTEDTAPPDTEDTEDTEPRDTEDTEDTVPPDTEDTEDTEPPDTEDTEPPDTEDTEDTETEVVNDTDSNPLLNCEDDGWCLMDIPAGVTETLSAVHGCSVNDVWAAGRNGIILHYNGSTWTEMYSGTSQNLRDIHCVSSTSVWAAGENATVVVFNGDAWSVAGIPELAGNYNKIWAADENNVFFTSDAGVVLQYRDGNFTFMEIGSFSSEFGDVYYPPFKGIWGSDVDDIWIGGAPDYLLHMTYTGGEWVALPQWGYTEIDDIQGVYGQVRFAVGQDDVEAGAGHIAQYSGASWEWVYSSYGDHYSGIFNLALVSDIEGYGIGYGRFMDEAWGDIHELNGDTWEYIGSLEQGGRDIWAATNGTIFVVGQNASIYRHG